VLGFSASGSFANRLLLLHPDRILAAATGGINSFPMLPISNLNGTNLEFPLGIHDIETITKKRFEREIWLKVPQLIFMGALDENDALEFDDAYSEPERQKVYALLAEPMQPRWQAAQAIYLNEKPNVTFVTYGNVGHWTDGQVNSDVVNFVRIAIRRSEGR
jgi:hypothetical protein